MTYYNTTSVSGDKLVTYMAETESQEQRILNMFRKIPKMSASQCWMKMYTKEPITSIRRGITNLVRAGVLRKTDIKVTGYYGKPEYVYELPSQQQTLW